jgi:hypothetical protein
VDRDPPVSETTMRKVKKPEFPKKVSDLESEKYY